MPRHKALVYQVLETPTTLERAVTKKFEIILAIVQIDVLNSQGQGLMDVSFLQTNSLRAILSDIGGFYKSLGILLGSFILFILRRAIRGELEELYPNYKE